MSLARVLVVLSAVLAVSSAFNFSVELQSGSGCTLYKESAELNCIAKAIFKINNENLFEVDTTFDSKLTCTTAAVTTSFKYTPINALVDAATDPFEATQTFSANGSVVENGEIRRCLTKSLDITSDSYQALAKTGSDVCIVFTDPKFQTQPEVAAQFGVKVVLYALDSAHASAQSQFALNTLNKPYQATWDIIKIINAHTTAYSSTYLKDDKVNIGTVTANCLSSTTTTKLLGADPAEDTPTGTMTLTVVEHNAGSLAQPVMLFTVFAAILAIFFH